VRVSRSCCRRHLRAISRHPSAGASIAGGDGSATTRYVGINSCVRRARGARRLPSQGPARVARRIDFCGLSWPRSQAATALPAHSPAPGRTNTTFGMEARLGPRYGVSLSLKSRNKRTRHRPLKSRASLCAVAEQTYFGY
jgi:hypothetical protein